MGKWMEVSILEVCEFERGTEPGREFYNTEGEGIPFIRVGNISAQIQEQVYTTSENVKICNKDDILIALDGSPGVVIKGVEGAFSSGLRKVIIKKPDEVLKNFVYYVLQADFVQNVIKAHTTGVTIKHASKSLEFIKIPIPPINIQEKIVKMLDIIQEAIGIQEKIIEKTRELKKSLMAELFTLGAPSFRKGRKLKKTEIGEIPEDWQVVKLGEVCTIRNEQVLPKSSEKYVGLEHLDTGEVKIRKWGKGDEVKSLKNKFYPGDILYGKLRPYLDKAALASFEGVCSTDVLVIVFISQKVMPYYLIYLLHTQNFLNFAIGTMSGTNHPRTSWQSIKSFPLPLPSLPEQKEIAEILRTVDEKIEIEVKKKELYEELFKTVLNKIMDQEIDVEKIEV